MDKISCPWTYSMALFSVPETFKAEVNTKTLVLNVGKILYRERFAA